MLKMKLTAGSKEAYGIAHNQYRTLPQYQWERELVQNAIDADATTIDLRPGFHPKIAPGPTANHGLANFLVVEDNGRGMNLETLQKFASLGCETSAGNFGWGGRISTLPWSDMVVLTYQNGKGLGLRIQTTKSNDFDVDLYEDILGMNGADGIRWDKVASSTVRNNHGTCVILTGNKSHPITIRGDHERGENTNRGIIGYLNNRYINLTARGITVRAFDSSPGDEQMRSVQGAMHYVARERNKVGGRLEDNNIIVVDKGRVRVEWYLWSGEKTNCPTYGVKDGAIFFAYNGEFYGTAKRSAVDYGRFGVIEGSVRKDLFLIIHADPKGNGKWGVLPDASRKGLEFFKGGEPTEMPLDAWGKEFAENMPDAIRKRLDEARANQATFQMSVDQRIRQYISAFKNSFGKVLRASAEEWAETFVADPNGNLFGKPTGKTTILKPNTHGPGTGNGGSGGKGVAPAITAREAEVLAESNAKRGLVAGVMAKTGNNMLPRIDPKDGICPDATGAAIQWFPAPVGVGHIYLQHPLVKAYTDRARKEYAHLPPGPRKAAEERTLASIITHVATNIYVVESLRKKLGEDVVNNMLKPEALTVSLAGVAALDGFITSNNRGIGSRKK